MGCPSGGFPSICHNEIKDLIAKVLATILGTSHHYRQTSQQILKMVSGSILQLIAFAEMTDSTLSLTYEF